MIDSSVLFHLMLGFAGVFILYFHAGARERFDTLVRFIGLLLIAVAFYGVWVSSAHAADLNISEYKDDHIRGQFSNPAHPPLDSGEEAQAQAEAAPAPGSQAKQKLVKSSVVTFDSRCTSQKCEVVLTFSDSPKKLRVVKNLSNEDFHLRFGNFRMTRAQQDALIKLEEQLNTGALNKTPPFTPAEDLLIRVVRILNEAPLGTKLGNDDLQKPRNIQPPAPEPEPENMSMSAPQNETPDPIQLDADGKMIPTEEDERNAWEAIYSAPDTDIDPDRPWLDAPLVPMPVTPDRLSMNPNPKDGDCVVDPLGARRPSHLFMLAATCCQSCIAPNIQIGTSNLNCFPRLTAHWKDNWHDAVGPLVYTFCRGVAMPAGYHCMKRMFLPFGSRAFDRFQCAYNTCPGRCGSGCGGVQFGTSQWTEGCLNHDYCVRSHRANPFSPNDPNCGDEWRDAYKDTLYAWWQPGGC
jgi:hypothetical protein